MEHEINEAKHLKCPSCKCYRLSESFLNKTKRKLKTCSKCRDFNKKYRKKKKNNPLFPSSINVKDYIKSIPISNEEIEIIFEEDQ